MDTRTLRVEETKTGVPPELPAAARKDFHPPGKPRMTSAAVKAGFSASTG